MGLAGAIALTATTALAAEPDVLVPAPADGTTTFSTGVAHPPGEMFVGEREQRRVIHYIAAGQTYSYDTEIADFSREGFGRAVAADAQYILIGAVDSNLSEGSVHLYVRSGGGFMEADAVISTVDNNQLGREVFLDGDTAVAFANDGAHVYDLTVGTLAEVQVVAEAVYTGGYDGDTIVALEAGDDTMGGIVRVFRRTDATFASEAVLRASDFEEINSFLRAVAVDEDTIIVSADVPSFGVAVFTRTGTTWELSQTVDAIGSESSFPGDPVIMQLPFAIVGNANSEGTWYALQGDTWAAQGTVPPVWSGDFSDTRLALGAFRSIVDDEPGWVNVFTDTGRALKGTTCGGTEDCLSGWCVDGVCCTVECAGVCEACSMALGASEDGECTVLPATECCREDADCVSNERCLEEACVPECMSDAQCDDGEPCTMDRCGGGGCIYELVPGCVVEPPDDTGDSSAGSGGSQTGGDTDTAGTDQPALVGGCGCGVSDPDRGWPPWLLVAAFGGWFARRRRRRV